MPSATYLLFALMAVAAGEFVHAEVGGLGIWLLMYSGIVVPYEFAAPSVGMIVAHVAVLILATGTLAGIMSTFTKRSILFLGIWCALTVMSWQTSRFQRNSSQNEWCYKVGSELPSTSKRMRFVQADRLRILGIYGAKRGQ